MSAMTPDKTSLDFNSSHQPDDLRYQIDLRQTNRNPVLSQAGALHLAGTA